MANITSGKKRAWEGEENEAHKRPRDRDEAKDWRDVHLKSPARKPSGRPQGHDRRSPGRYDSGGRSSGSGAGNRRESTYKRSSNARDIHHSRDDRRRSDYRSSRSPPRRTRSRSRELRAEEEKEEGEISPHRAQSPAPISALPKNNGLISPLARSSEQLPAGPEMELDVPPSPPPVEDVLAARRAKRQAILAKYAGVSSLTISVSPSPGPSSAAQPPNISSSLSNLALQTQGESTNDARTSNISKTPAVVPTSRRESSSPSPTSDDFALAKEEKLESDQTPEQPGAEQVSAADYDPNFDRREDEHRRFGVDGSGGEEEIEEVEEEDDDLDDMFAISPAGKKKTKYVKKVKVPKAPALIANATLDSAADPEGYYSVILGEHLDGGKYQVFSSLGKGMFANVVRARVLQCDSGDTGKEVAIKIIRCQESMFRAGQKEIQMLNKLKEADPDDKKHLIRLERTFEHRGHLCLVFESMSMNLRDVVKRFGKDVGLNIRAVRAYAHQLFLALSLLRKLNIMHADIKPDNILVNEQKTMLKLCDLGSASDASENDITPYLVSRFYRAPEIILGIPYDPALDIWSIGCTLYELYTGKILFPGRSNNQMILLMMELKGRFNSKMIKKAKFGSTYFDEMGGFESVEKDRITGNDVVRKVHISKPTRDLRARLIPPASAKMNDDENKLIMSFVDLLDKCLALDPGRRITPREALTHPFIRG